MTDVGRNHGGAVDSQEWDRRIQLAADHIRSFLKASDLPQVAVVLGSGFKSYGATLSKENKVKKVKLVDVPFFPSPKVKGHGGSILFGRDGETPVAVFEGRVHMYEGYSPQEVVFGVRVIHRLGVRSIVLTNAAGGVGAKVKPGDAVLISDQINLTGQHCLTGEGGYFGPQFLDMSECYDGRWRKGLKQKFKLKEGVYIGLTGPTYETRAECAMLQVLGGDLVGMSTVQEAIAAHHLGMRVGGISFVSNMSGGSGGGEKETGKKKSSKTSILTHDEVIALGKKYENHLRDVLSFGVSEMAKIQ